MLYDVSAPRRRRLWQVYVFCYETYNCRLSGGNLLFSDEKDLLALKKKKQNKAAFLWWEADPLCELINPGVLFPIGKALPASLSVVLFKTLSIQRHVVTQEAPGRMWLFRGGPGKSMDSTHRTCMVTRGRAKEHTWLFTGE